MADRSGRNGGTGWRPPASLALVMALALGLGVLVATTAAGSALAWALYGLMVVAFVAAYRGSRRGDLWRAIERRTGMRRTESSALLSALIVVSILDATLHLADWLYVTALVVGLAIAALLWTQGPRDAFRRTVAVPVMLRVAPVVAALVVAGLLGAAWWLEVVILLAGFAAVDFVSSPRRG